MINKVKQNNKQPIAGISAPAIDTEHSNRDIPERGAYGSYSARKVRVNYL